MWIHERQNWTDFKWDNERLMSQLSSLRFQQGRLLGRMEELGFEFRQEAGLDVLTSDIVKSSSIEGEMLNQEEVRSSIARRLGITIHNSVPVGRHVEGVVEMTLDATRNYSAPLTQKRLFGWHSSLFPTGYSGMYPIRVGKWRTEEEGRMNVISGPIGREKIHFQAPLANRLHEEMKKFLDWFNGKQGIDWVIKAGIAHLWFVTIHPFQDGNGRIARAIGDMALSRADASSVRFYSLSSQIEAERKEYYRQLERQQRSSSEITGWLDWFLSCMANSVARAEDALSHVLYKAKLWKRMEQANVNNRQTIVVGRMLEPDFKGYINTSKYAKLTKCSNDTALRDIQELKRMGILVQNPGAGRSTSYRLMEKVE